MYKRQQNSLANVIIVFIRSNFFRKDLKQYSCSKVITLPYPTNSSFILNQYALKGIEDQMDAPKPIQGDAYSLNLPQLAKNWINAIELFENDHAIKNIFPESLVGNLVLTKKQEFEQLDKIISADKWKYYINSI